MSGPEEITEVQDLVIPTGKSILQFLQDSRNGATMADIMQHIRTELRDTDSELLNRNVTTILEKGAAMGFLERRGSRFVNWVPREEGCGRRRRRRKSSCCCKKKKKRRRRSCGKRRRKRRC